MSLSQHSLALNDVAVVAEAVAVVVPKEKGFLGVVVPKDKGSLWVLLLLQRIGEACLNVAAELIL